METRIDTGETLEWECEPLLRHSYLATFASFHVAYSICHMFVSKCKLDMHFLLRPPETK